MAKASFPSVYILMKSKKPKLYIMLVATVEVRISTLV